MPLRDHFRAPFTHRRSWDEIHGGWPMVIAEHLNTQLPPEYFAAPRVHLGSQYEIDVGAFDAPTDEYETLIYHQDGRRLVAAIEIISPANKDRPETRNRFATKCTALMLDEVAVILIDVVTTRRANLYADLLAQIGEHDPAIREQPPTYAAACRWRPQGKKGRLDT